MSRSGKKIPVAPWTGEYDVTEQHDAPTTLDEARWLPFLADLECSRCGQLGCTAAECVEEET